MLGTRNQGLSKQKKVGKGQEQDGCKKKDSARNYRRSTKGGRKKSNVGLVVKPKNEGKGETQGGGVPAKGGKLGGLQRLENGNPGTKQKATPTPTRGRETRQKNREG